MATIRLHTIRSSAVAILLLGAALPAAAQQLEDVTWTNQSNVTAYGNKLAEACNGCGSAYAESQQTLTSGDGYVEFMPSTAHDVFTVGIGSGPPSADARNFEYAFRFHGNGVVEVREHGTFVVDTPYRVGDRFRIAVDGGAIKYYKHDGTNATLIHTNPRPSLSYPLKVEAALSGKGTQVEQVIVARGRGAQPQVSAIQDTQPRVPQPITWEHLTNATVEGTKLIGHTEDQNSGAVSAESITGDGFIEFTADRTDKMRAIGLDNYNGAHTFHDLDFGIVLRQNGIAEVWEGGKYITDTPYSAGTRFRIGVDGGVVKYYKYVNDQLQQIQARDTKVANFPLHADAAMYEPQAAISDVTGMRLN
jgi:hypothetical protein